MPTSEAFDQKARWFDNHSASVRGRVRLTLVLERLAEIPPPSPASVIDAGGGSCSGRGGRIRTADLLVPNQVR